MATTLLEEGAGAELRLVGGESTREAQELTKAAAAAGLSVKTVALASDKGQAALAAQGPGAIRLPLVIVEDTYSLQRPPFSAVIACLAALRAGECALPDGAVRLGRTSTPVR